MPSGQIPGTVFESNFQILSATTAITAFATGGQSGAIPLVAQVNRITTCASTGDSVKLPAAVAGISLFLANAGAASLNVFPNTGDQINALGANAAFAVASGKSAEFIATASGQWHAILSA
jgi:hypothetical protein